MSDDGVTQLGAIEVRGYTYEPAVNAPLANELGMPSSTLFYRPDREAGFVDYRTSKDADTQTAYFDEDKEAAEGIPNPTAADPAPPEIIPDEQEARAVCLSPDVCKTPEKPCPFMAWGTAENDTDYSPNVFSNGDAVKHQQSLFSRCYGDEAGVGLGVKSGTVEGTVEPITSSPIVNVNGIPIQRHNDFCTLNNGNAVGEYCYVRTTDVNAPPTGTDEQDKEGVAPDSRTAGERFSDGFTDNASETWDGVKQVSSDVWDGTKDLASDLWNDPSGTIAAGAESVKDGAVGAANWASEVGQNLYDDPSATLGRGWDNTKNTASSIWHAVADPYSEAYEEGGLAQALGHGSFDVVKLALEALATKGAATAAGKATTIGAGAAAKAHRVEEAADAAHDARQIGAKVEDGAGGARSTAKESEFPHCIACTVTGNPVFVASGRPVEEDPGFTLPDPLAIDIGSTYYGDLDRDGPLGHRRISAIDSFIELTDEKQLRLMDAAPWPVPFPQPPVNSSLWEQGKSPRRIEIRAGVGDTLVVREGTRYRDYTRFRDGVWRLTKIYENADLKIVLVRDDAGLLTSISHPSGLSVRFDNDLVNDLRLAAHLVATSGESRVVLRYGYDSERNLISVEAPYGGGATQYRYDDRHRLVFTSKAHGYRSRRLYDDEDRVIATETNGPHNGNRFDYDDKLRVMTFRPGLGGDSLERYYLNEHSAIVAQANGLGHFRRSDYRNGRLARDTDAEGNSTEYGYNARGELQSVRDGEGRETTYLHDGAGRIRLSMDAAGNTWKYSYDKSGAICQITDPLGHITEIKNNSFGLPVGIMRHDGLLQQRVYDAQHRLTAIRDFRGELTKFAYDAFGRLNCVTDPQGNVTRFGYDEAGGLGLWEPSRLQRPDGVVVTSSMSANRVERRVIDGEGRQTVYRYGFGPENRLTEIENGNGGKLSFGYDGLERVISVTSQLGHVWSFERDAAGRVIREEDFDGLVFEYAYDRADRLIETRYADGTSHRFAYDRSGLLIKEEVFARLSAGETEADAQPLEVTRYSYDPRAMLERAENAAGLVEYERDGLGRVLAETVNGRRIESVYDCCGNRLQRRISGRLIEASFDPLGVIESLVIGDHSPLAFKRDTMGRELTRASATGFFLRQGFDTVGQLVSQQIGSTGGPSAFGDLSLGGARGDGMEAIRRAGFAAPGLERHYGWDRAWAPVSLRDSEWGETTYAYDENGQVLRKRFGDGEVERFRYDAAMNTAGFGETTGDGPDGFGVTAEVAGANYLQARSNQGMQSWQIAPSGRVKRATGPEGETVNLEHDRRGRVTRRTLERNGFRPRSWIYEWDIHNRLVGCTTPAGEVWHYAYDALGRRIRKTRALTSAELKFYAGRFPEWVDPATAQPDYAGMLLPLPSEHQKPIFRHLAADMSDRSPVVGIAYSWDGDVIAEEAPLRLDGSIDWDDATRWHHEPDSFRPLAKETADGSLYYIVNDHLGTPREMVDEAGGVVWAAEYRTWGELRRLRLGSADNDNGSPGAGRAMYPGRRAARDDGGYGENVFSTGRTFGNLALKDDPEARESRSLCPIRFQGQWEDEESGLYYNRFRYYDPLAGQYVSPDPIGVAAGVRPYGYVSTATKLVDSFGLAAWAPRGSGICIVQKFAAGSPEANELAEFVGEWNKEIIARGGRMTAGPLTDLQAAIQKKWRDDFKARYCCGPGKVAGHRPDAAAGGLPNPELERGLIQSSKTNSYLGGITGDLSRKGQSYTWVHLRDSC